MKRIIQSILLTVGIILIASSIVEWNWIKPLLGGFFIGLYNCMLYETIKSSKK